ncbi:MAG: hypothetical protein M1817_002310 [Caeruleum heppii]|nr:MAG: hypothetical protein M1817_002310 [Caeruleum heppii]
MRLAQILSNYLGRSSTRFQFMSDLHLEVGQQYSSFEIPQKAPFLILAGDIGRLADYDPFREFLQLQCQRFEKVYLVLGNHEFFGVSRQEGLRLVDQLEREPGLKDRLTILNRRRVDLDASDHAPITILGCTLQSYVPPEARDVVGHKINDFRRILSWTVEDHVAEHIRDVQWLKEQITSIRRQEEGQTTRRIIIVVTRHAPSTRGTSSPLNQDNAWKSAFGTDLLGLEDGEESCLNDVQWWIFGHTHYSTQFTSGKVNVISNQRGYVMRENSEPDGRSARKLISAWNRKAGDQISPKKEGRPFDVGRIIQV